MTTSRPRTGCFPGSFDPLTVGHIAVADAAYDQCGVTRVDLVLSRVALGKSEHHHSLEQRVRFIREATADRPWLDVAVTEAKLLVDIAEGYDVLILGADKWLQLLDPSFYDGSEAARDRAVARLPLVACAPRAGLSSPPRDVVVLDVPDWVQDVSATAVRAGATQWRAGPRTRQSPE